MGAEQLSPASRYHGLEVAQYVGVDGAPRPYLRRRFIAQPEQLGLLTSHTVVGGDRLDLIAARYLGDPEQFWRVCDGNRALRPDDLIAGPGRRLRITLPPGLPGVADA